MILILPLMGLCASAFSYLLFCVNPNSNSIASKVRYFFFVKMFNAIVKIGEYLFGKNFKGYIISFRDYIFFSNNGIVMFFYLLFIPGSIILYFVQIVIPYWDVMYKVVVYPSILLILLGLYCYYKAVVTDPGTIDKLNWKVYYEKYAHRLDGIIFKKDNICTTCKIPKPASSKHCSLCKKCVSKLDHHCVWIKGCVGEKNHKYFIGFLATHALFCLIGFLVSL